MLFKKLWINFTLVWIAIVGGFSGCSIYDPEVKIPAYVQVDSVSFSSDLATKGFNSQSITEVWIFVNNQTVGIYSIPTGKIPVLAEGNADISVGAGVIADGINGNKVLYPFFKQYVTQLVLEKEKVHKISPDFSYQDTLKIPFIYYRDFERTDSGFTQGKNGTVVLERATTAADDKEKFGNRYGLLKAINEKDVLEYSNDIPVPLRQNGMPVYLEFDYKSTCEMQVGISGVSSFAEYPDLVLLPRSSWTKMYVNLTDEAEAFPKGEKFRFFLRSTTTPGIGNSFSIDNIRLIHF